VSWWVVLKGLIPNLVTQAGEIFKRRHELKLKKIDVAGRIEEAKAEGMIAMLSQRQTADIDWESMSIQNSGWRDEYMTLFLTTIVGACFVPSLQPTVVAGFDTLTNGTPVWFQISFLIVVGSAFGVRVFTNFREAIGFGKKKP